MCFTPIIQVLRKERQADQKTRLSSIVQWGGGQPELCEAQSQRK